MKRLKPRGQMAKGGASRRLCCWAGHCWSKDTGPWVSGYSKPMSGRRGQPVKQGQTARCHLDPHSRAPRVPPMAANRMSTCRRHGLGAGTSTANGPEPLSPPPAFQDAGRTWRHRGPGHAHPCSSTLECQCSILHHLQEPSIRGHQRQTERELRPGEKAEETQARTQNRTCARTKPCGKAKATGCC